MKLLCNFDLKETTLGRINSGSIFLYNDKLWIVLNPGMDKGSKLIRSLIGEFNVSLMLESDTIVYVVINEKIEKNSFIMRSIRTIKRFLYKKVLKLL